MTRLSVNVNKIATVRNSRGGSVPSVLDAAEVVAAAGAGGITVHPRIDRRHITFDDVRTIADRFRDRWSDALEYNIEGDPQQEWLDLVCATRPRQATLVPVAPGEVTSSAGWVPDRHRQVLEPAVRRLRAAGIRVSLFVDPEADAVRWAQAMGADRIELYTEPYARAFERGRDDAERSFARYVAAAEEAHARGIGINAGHDLDLANLVLFRTLPHLDEVSIGHALVSRAIFVGLDRVVREYLDVLRGV